MSERPEGAEIVGIKRERGKKGDIIAVATMCRFRSWTTRQWLCGPCFYLHGILFSHRDGPTPSPSTFSAGLRSRKRLFIEEKRSRMFNMIALGTLRSVESSGGARQLFCHLTMLVIRAQARRHSYNNLVNDPMGQRPAVRRSLRIQQRTNNMVEPALIPPPAPAIRRSKRLQGRPPSPSPQVRAPAHPHQLPPAPVQLHRLRPPSRAPALQKHPTSILTQATMSPAPVPAPQRLVWHATAPEPCTYPSRNKRKAEFSPEVAEQPSKRPKVDQNDSGRVTIHIEVSRSSQN